jgi:alpha-galactosidase
MDIDLTGAGLRLVGSGGRVELGPALPAVVVRTGGRSRTWRPTELVLDADRGVLRADGGPGGLRLELDVRHAADAADQVEVVATLTNDGHSPVQVERLTALSTDQLRVGERSARWRTYRNGYQSWAGTRTIGTDERDADVVSPLVRLSTTDARHPSPTGVGHVRSDSLTAIAEPHSGDALGLAVTELAAAFAFVELVAPAGVVERLEVWSDLDGVPLAPGESVRCPVRIAAARGRGAGERALRAVAGASGRAMHARATDRPHPGGWCSWYYYFTDVTQADVRENLDVLAADGRNGPTYACEYVMVDDGHQSQIGDWLHTDAAAFPDGMADLASRIRGAGFDAGIWWAPFLAHPDSQVARDHPDWLLRGARGRRVVGMWNPNWSLRTPMHVLDTTRPDVLEHLRSVASVIGHEWGYAIQKLDFLYAAALPAVRHDPTATRAQALRLGLEAIREGAGDDGFLLGCGCPLGPAVGVVDAMRIGADVTPYWSNLIDKVVGRGRHALATRNAVVNVATRAPLDRSWWLNDPDCLMVRDDRTKLTDSEVEVLATVMGMTDGMLVISDRLSLLPTRRREMIARTRELAGGRVEVADLFEQELPELLVSRHDGHTDVAALNLADRPRRASVELHLRGVDCPDGELRELWTGARVQIASGIADLGTLPAHSARVLRIPHQTSTR